MNSSSESGKSSESEPTPLKAIAIPNVGEIVPRGLILVVGPNSSGKTHLLKDIEARLVGEQRVLVVCDEIKTEIPDSFQPFLSRLISAGHVRTTTDNQGHEQIRQWSLHVGKGSSDWTLTPPRLQNYHQQALANPSGKEGIPFFKHIGATYVTSLFLDRRLRIVSQSSFVDYENNPPSNELQALYVNKQSRRKLREELVRVFRKAVWLDNTRGVLCLRVNDSPEFPSDADRLEPEVMRRYRTIEDEGDGLKSYAGICISLLVERRPVCLIDEPEMCLHPPQAYSLGQFIGKHGTSPHRSTFVATHSSHVLRGIIEATEDLQILRLSRVGTQFVGSVIPYDALMQCIQRPSTRIETILDGVFSEAVTVVESEGDRVVYSAACEKLVEQSRSLSDPVTDDIPYDMHFVSVGGAGGIASTCALYKQLRIPVAVIADLDVMNKEQCKPVLESLTHREDATSILKDCHNVIDEIRQLQPILSENDFKGGLQEMRSRELDWSKGHAQELRRQLTDLASRLSHLAILKRGGIANFADKTSILHKLKAILGRCRSVGLFLVEVGELEYWLKGIMDGASKSKKSEWANEAALRIRQRPPQDDDIWEFIRKIASYQRDQANRLSGYS